MIVVKKLMTLENMMVCSLNKMSDGCQEDDDVGGDDGVLLEQDE